MKKNFPLYLGFLCLVKIANSQTPIVFEAESGTIGVTSPTPYPVEWRTKTVRGVTFIVDTVPVDSGIANSGSGTRANGNIPDRAERTVTYTITFPVPGTYDLYARISTGPSGGNTNAFFYASNFGVKPLGTDNSNVDPGNNWINCKPLDVIGFDCPTIYVTYDATYNNTNGSSGSANSDQKPRWKWVHISGMHNNPSETPVSFVVPDGALTQIFQIAARLHYVNLDKFAFCLQRDKSNKVIFYSADKLDDVIPGDTTPPPQAAIPPPSTQTPIATGKNKFLGCAYSPTQAPYFERYFNQVTPEDSGKWGNVETTDGTYNFTNVDNARNFAKKNGFPFRYHVLVWGQQQPLWLKSYTDSQKVVKIKAWFQAVAQHYDGSSNSRAPLEYVEVVNEALNDPPDNIGKNAVDSASGGYLNALRSLNAELNTSPGEFDWVINAFKLARRYFPSTTKLVINEFRIESDTTYNQRYRGIIDLLKKENLIDVIGIQGHGFSTINQPTSLLANQLNLLASKGLPIQITEMDIDGNVGAIIAERDANQKAEYERVFNLYWNHPSVMGITLWGYRRGMWRTAEQCYLIDPCYGFERPAMRDYLIKLRR